MHPSIYPFGESRGISHYHCRLLQLHIVFLVLDCFMTVSVAVAGAGAGTAAVAAATQTS